MPAENTKPKCYPCAVCEGTGMQWTEKQNKIEYDICDHCEGHQCFSISGGLEADYFLGACNGSCGRNREMMRELGIE